MNIKIISSLEKIFKDENLNSIKSIREYTALKNEIVSFQIVLRSSQLKKIKIDTFTDGISIRRVCQMPSSKPVFKEKYDDYYITDKPGMFPDLLIPLENNSLNIDFNNTILWINLKTNDFSVGHNEITINFKDIEKEDMFKCTLNLKIIDIILPSSDLIYSNWLYADCIADYYHLDTKSNEHWNWIEKFIKKSSDLGVNMSLIPIFTLPLDTAINKERRTFQLINIKVKDGKYIFDFTDFEKWVNICKKNNIKYYEIGHLFTQWGAKATPKIEANVDGINKKIFGWNVASNSEEYKIFLSKFLPALDEELEKLNISKETYFHISDEPNSNDLNNYNYAKKLISNILHNKYKIIDASSSLELYEKKIVEIPMPATSKYDPFYKKRLKERWCYYCGYNSYLVSNRLFSMPSYRNRIFGIQLYYIGIIGFIHWGFNFYNSQYSLKNINPFEITDGDNWVPSGDPFIVYPGKTEVLDSIRGMIFYEGLQDRMLLKLLEEKIGRKKVINLINKSAQQKIDFKNYPHNGNFIINLRENIINLLKDD